MPVFKFQINRPKKGRRTIFNGLTNFVYLCIYFSFTGLVISFLHTDKYLNPGLDFLADDILHLKNDLIFKKIVVTALAHQCMEL